jgi:serine/threonine protein kinase
VFVPQEQEDCIKEVTVLAILESQYIITYYDSFIEQVLLLRHRLRQVVLPCDTSACQPRGHLQGKLYIVTEYAAGGTLTDFIKASPARLPEGLIWKLFIQVGARLARQRQRVAQPNQQTPPPQMLLALHHMHSKKILHRDVKTLNVFLTSTDPSTVDVKLGDVGVARVRRSLQGPVHARATHPAGDGNTHVADGPADPQHAVHGKDNRRDALLPGGCTAQPAGFTSAIHTNHAAPLTMSRSPYVP